MGLFYYLFNYGKHFPLPEKYKEMNRGKKNCDKSLFLWKMESSMNQPVSINCSRDALNKGCPN